MKLETYDEVDMTNDYGVVGFLLAKDELVFCCQRTNRLGKVECCRKVEDCGRCGWLSVGEERASQLAKVV